MHISSSLFVAFLLVFTLESCSSNGPSEAPDASSEAPDASSEMPDASVAPLPCEGVECGPHGTCAEADAGVMCACLPGYAGATCAECAAGYHRDVDGACAFDETCELVDIDCGHGVCDDAGGVVSCECEAGYDGATCEACAAGYHEVEGGACAVDETCDAGSCQNGVCDDTSGVIVCACDPGYLSCGDSCELPGAGTVDQSFDDTTQTCESSYAGQSFTAGRSGYLTRLSFDVGMAPDTTVTLTIYEGSKAGVCNPAGALLLTQEFPNTTWELGTLQTITLETPIEVIAGEKYTFKLQPEAGTGTAKATCQYPGSYAGGVGLCTSYWDIRFAAYVADCP